MNDGELQRLVRQSLPGVDICDSEAVLRQRAQNEMTFYLRLILKRLQQDEQHETVIRDRHARVVELLKAMNESKSSSG